MRTFQGSENTWAMGYSKFFEVDQVMIFLGTKATERLQTNSKYRLTKLTNENRCEKRTFHKIRITKTKKYAFGLLKINC